jgi:hypothetical protein
MTQAQSALRQAAELLLTLYYRLPGDSPVARGLKLHADLCCLALPSRYLFSKEQTAEMKKAALTPEMNLLSDRLTRSIGGLKAYPFGWYWDENECCYVRNYAMLKKDEPGTLMYVINAKQGDTENQEIAKRMVETLLKLNNELCRLVSPIREFEGRSDG